MDCFLAVDGTLKIEPTVKSSSNDSIQEELPKLPKEPNSSTVLNRDTHPERVLRLSVDHIRKTFRFFKIKNFSRTFFRNFNFQNFFSRNFENWNVKRLSQKIPNSPSIENPSEYGELVDKSLELQYEQERFIKCKITILSLFWWFVIFEHVCTCLLLTVLVTLPIHVFKMP